MSELEPPLMNQTSDAMYSGLTTSPMIYLHYDPYTRRSIKQSGALYRQRMDFLLLAPDRSRIVIEVDGVQHYGRPN
ncbi:hypothetical protein [Streptomyces sp. NPDC005784]|uniref:hypothetical protein n=1 Tax=Streptomyces sp. NPDC005784 TaxID=3364731 RepID=UPI00369331B1